MKKRPVFHLTASADYIEGFLAGMASSGRFFIEFPIVEPNKPWPKSGDIVIIHPTDRGPTMLAWIRTINQTNAAEVARAPAGSVYPKMTASAGRRLRVPMAVVPGG